MYTGCASLIIDPASYNCSVEKIKIINRWCNSFNMYFLENVGTFHGSISILSSLSGLGSLETPDAIVNRAYDWVSNIAYDMVTVCELEQEHN